MKPQALTPVWAFCLLLGTAPTAWAAAGSSAAPWLEAESASMEASPETGDKKADDEKHDGHGDEKHDGHDGEHAENHGDGPGKKGHGKKGHGGGHGHGSALSDVAKPLDIEGMPERPKPLLELGEPFLGTGTLKPGIQLPTGAVWQPAMLVFGNWRTAVQSFDADNGGGRITEVATRLDLFANLSLSGSERLVLGVRALDGMGEFTSYFLEHPDPSLDGEFRDVTDADIEILFFEGDFGEIFPNLDRDDFGSTDIGFSVGRQNLLFQEGLLMNDNVDGVGFTRNTLLPKGTSNFRSTFFYGWGDVNTSAFDERDARLFALLTSTDFLKSTVDADVAYVQADDLTGDLVVAGVSAVQRIGAMNSAFRVLGSHALDEENAFSSDGYLLFSELSWVPHGTHDLVYVNNFLAVDDFVPAARGVGGAGGGPLGRAGINFASADLGSFDAPLSNRASDVFGGAFGYQRFFNHTRQQILMELGYRIGTSNEQLDSYAATVRYQSAYGKHTVLVLDGFVGRQETLTGNEVPFGGRIELLFKF